MSNRLFSFLSNAAQGSSGRWWVLTAVECGNFVVYMDGFIVTLALPAMSRHFDVGLHEVKWVVIAYLAALTATLLVAGRLADLWGRRRVMVAGAALLTLASVLCAMASSLTMLIACRVVQGLGGALVLANVMAEITATFPREVRRRVMSINASVLALGQVSGLVLGGILIHWLGWPSIFVFTAVVSGIGALLSAIVLRDHPVEPGATLDLWGAFLSILIVGGSFLFVERALQSLNNPAYLVLPLLAGVVMLGLFVAVEWRSPRPLIDLNLFRSRSYLCGALAAMFYFSAAVSCFFLLPLFAQIVLKMSPFAAGLVMVPLSVALTASSQLVGYLPGHLTARVLSTAGILCACAAVYWLSTIDATTSVVHIMAPLVLLGVGGGLFHPPNNGAVLARVPPGELGSANGLFTTVRNFGQALGTVLASGLLGQGLKSVGMVASLGRDPGALDEVQYLSAFVQSQAHAFRVAALLALVGAGISVLRSGGFTIKTDQEHIGEPAPYS